MSRKRLKKPNMLSNPCARTKSPVLFGAFDVPKHGTVFQTDSRNCSDSIILRYPSATRKYTYRIMIRFRLKKKNRCSAADLIRKLIRFYSVSHRLHLSVRRGSFHPDPSDPSQAPVRMYKVPLPEVPAALSERDRFLSS